MHTYKVKSCLWRGDSLLVGFDGDQPTVGEKISMMFGETTLVLGTVQKGNGDLFTVLRQRRVEK